MSRKLIVYVMMCLVVMVSMAGSGYPETQTKKFEKGDKFIIVLIPEKNVFEQRKRYKSITDYLSKELGLEVQTKLLPSYGEICGALTKGKADAGFFGSFSYVLTSSRTGMEPVARPLWTDGSSTYSGYIFVRKDGGIKTVGDMKGKRLALVHKATTAGYVFQKDYFSKHGINNMEDYFSDVYFAGSHDASAWSVYIGESDVGAAKNHIYNALVRENPDFRENMMILAESPEVPSNGLAIAGHVDPALRNRIKKLLLGLDKNSEGQKVLKEFKAVKFIDTKDEHYSVLKQMIKDANIDLSEYECK